MDVKLPKLGEGADSGVVVNIFVKEGERSPKDQAVIELENEKAVASVPSTAAGVVSKMFVKPGDRITWDSGSSRWANPANRQPRLTTSEAGRAGSPPANRRRRSDRPAEEEAEEHESEAPPCTVPPVARRPSAKWRVSWALICARCAAVKQVDALSSPTCESIFSDCIEAASPKGKRVAVVPRRQAHDRERLISRNGDPCSRKPLSPLAASHRSAHGGELERDSACDPV